MSGSLSEYRKGASFSGRSQSGFHVSIKDDTYSLCSSYHDTERNWRNIIFIPHKMQWKIVVVATILLNIFIASYYLVFTEVNLSLTYLMPFYACEAVYFVDVTLTLMHRYVKLIYSLCYVNVMQAIWFQCLRFKIKKYIQKSQKHAIHLQYKT